MGLPEGLQVVKQDFVSTNFNIPKTLQREGVAKKVGMRELSSDEELLASKLGKFDMLRSEYEAVKLSICSLDGNSVSTADGTVDVFWNRCGAKLRTLLLKAHGRVNNPSKAEEDEFFQSETVAV